MGRGHAVYDGVERVGQRGKDQCCVEGRTTAGRILAEERIHGNPGCRCLSSVSTVFVSTVPAADRWREPIAGVRGGNCRVPDERLRCPGKGAKFLGRSGTSFGTCGVFQGWAFFVRRAIVYSGSITCPFCRLQGDSMRDAGPLRMSDAYSAGRFGLSFEIFPPKTPRGDQSLQETLGRLARFRPTFISCTYGAGGSTRQKTLDWCAEIHALGIPATAHFTCVGSSRDELLDWLREATDQGISSIMALRGDPPAGEAEFKPARGGLRYANELVALIREFYPDLNIGVAGYPEKHQECCDARTDLVNLKRKVEAGADAVFTQLFYDNDCFFRFRDQYEAAGIDVPLVPGIMPITEFGRIKRITAMCGASFPEKLASRLEAVQDDAEAQLEIGVEHAIGQCRELIDAGAPGVHFYVLNRPEACEKILDATGLASHSQVASD